MKLVHTVQNNILGLLALMAVLLSVAPVMATDPGYQTAITAGLGTANTAGEAILTAGAVIIVTMIVFKVIKKFASRAS